MSLDTYTDPVAKLLTFGDCREMDMKNWIDYPEEFGLTDADIPELIRMSTDPELDKGDGLEIWAPIHAWRSLGQLHAEAAIPQLIELFKREDDDWISDDLPKAFGLIGGAAIQPLADFFADTSIDEWAKVRASNALEKIAKAFPEHQPTCIAVFTRQLESFADNGKNLNGCLISSLIELQAVEAAPVMEKAFAARVVDEFFTGTWANVQVELGLKTRADFSKKELTPEMPPYLKEIQKMIRNLDQMQSKPEGFGKANLTGSKSTKKKKKK